jgi:hypothetical protein
MRKWWLALCAAGSIALNGAAGSAQPIRNSKTGALQIGEVASVYVQARPKWNHSGIRLVRGGKYLITAQGTWWDAGSRHGPDGDGSPNFYMRWSEGLRRVRHENWFKLICALDSQKKTAFPVGSNRPTVAAADGELTCFANDVGFAYGNNTGAIQMTVKRTG